MGLNRSAPRQSLGDRGRATEPPIIVSSTVSAPRLVRLGARSRCRRAMFPDMIGATHRESRDGGSPPSSENHHRSVMTFNWSTARVKKTTSRDCVMSASKALRFVHPFSAPSPVAGSKLAKLGNPIPEQSAPLLPRSGFVQSPFIIHSGPVAWARYPIQRPSSIPNFVCSESKGCASSMPR